MIDIISILLEKGHAYKGEDGSVYFKLNSFPEYGRLAKIDKENLRPGVRIEVDEYTKDNVHDFALWKAYQEADGEIVFDSPFGRGRPGWHIECSAMAMKYLGNHFDMHTGGVDNIFPHHENEIAQSECSTGETYVNYWLHSEHLIVENKKMSKSLGNFFTLRDLIEKGYSPASIRYLLISNHYRQQLNFTFDGLDAAATCVDRLNSFKIRLKEIEYDSTLNNGEVSAEVKLLIEKSLEKFDASLCDDLNVSPALAAIFDLMNDVNSRIAEENLNSKEAIAVMEFLDKTNEILGIFRDEEDSIPEEVTKMLEERIQAKQDKNWALADELRDSIKNLGYVIEDTKKGSRVKKIQ